MSDSDFLAKLFADADRRGPGNDDTARRLARLCGVTKETKVLDLGCGAGPTARLLARELECEVTCVDVDRAALATLESAAARDGTAARLKVVAGDMRSVSLPEKGFDVVLMEGSWRHLGGDLAEAALAARKFVAPDGRLAVTLDARVGLVLPAAVEAFFRERGTPLATPSNLAVLLERAGFEPLSVEAWPDAILDEWYRGLEKRLAGGGGDGAAGRLRREVELFRREGARTCVAHIALVGRRKESGEKPPASRGGA